MTPLLYRDYRITVPWACAWVRTNQDGLIVDCAPIFRRKFLGSPLSHLTFLATSVVDITDLEHGVPATPVPLPPR